MTEHHICLADIWDGRVDHSVAGLTAVKGQSLISEMTPFNPARIQTVLSIKRAEQRQVASSPLNQTRVSRVLCEWTADSSPTIDHPPEDNSLRGYQSTVFILLILATVCTFKEAVILEFVQHFANDQNGTNRPSKH